MKNEQQLAKKHPVSFPLFVILGIMFISILVLGYFLYQTVAENTRLKQKYQDNTESIDQQEDSEMQQYEQDMNDL